MPIPFSRSTRSLDADSYRRSTLGTTIVLLVLGTWATWMFTARVALYEITSEARLEVEAAVYPIEAAVSGRVIATYLAIGKEVQAGDVLVELDSEAERLELSEEETRLATLAAQLAALRDRDNVEKQAQIETQQVAPVALDEARARYEEAEAMARAADEEARRLERLFSQGLLSEIEIVRARAEAQKRRSAADALRLNIDYLDKNQRVRQSDRQAQIEGIKGQIALLEGEINTRRATIERLSHEIEKRRIRAAATGRLGEAANLRAGSVVQAGDKLAAIVPAGALKLIADFQPSTALGRIEPGQRARLRLDGFPWAEYGSLSATVAKVAGEPRDGHIRAEFTVHPDPDSKIPLQHGLPGTVEVEVDRLSPAALVLRIGGKLLASPKTKAEVQTGEGEK
ncbi:MAG: HlyD family efflux transporter periplasmic adaptor subunit [Blastocatellia bacterium]|nr:HlyD family efflux transporter periplasmic adaptor subunit [Blastocatellia bacterium]